MSRAITLLGPQRRPSVQHVVGELSPDGPIATITAGWQEREGDDKELDDLLGGNSINLALHARWLDIHERDREFGHAEREHDSVLADLRTLYLSQLDHALRAAYGVAQTKEGRPRWRDLALDGAVDVVRLVDEQHLDRVRAAQHAFYDAWRPHERAVVVQHREELHRILANVQAVVLAGGHVGELTRVLHLFNLQPHLPQHVIAWSAGAMALSERVVLFHDFVPHGVAQTEVHGEGIGAVRGLVLLPHLRRRLRVDDQVRMSVLAKRFAPARCLALDDGVRVPLAPDGRPPGDARFVTEDGRVA